MNYPKKSHLPKYGKKEIFRLQKLAGGKVEEILTHFNLQGLTRNEKFYGGACPVHGGDNTSAFNIFHVGYEVVGNWRCFTHHCENHFHPSIIGFVRGVISHQKYGWTCTNDSDKECSFREAVEFLLKFTKQDSKTFEFNFVDLEKQKFMNQMKNFYENDTHAKPENSLNLTRDQVISSLIYPSPYFVSRGYSEEIISRYDVGDCQTSGKQMNMRSVVPIYNENHSKVIACSGRSIFEKCPNCACFHNPTMQCPEGRQKGIYRKWKHSKGFRADRHLYNYWFAKDHIKKTKVAILVEGPGDVWRLEEAGIKNSVCMFGTSLNEEQRNILDKSGAMALIVLTDPDQAGRVSKDDITKVCSPSYSVFSPVVSNMDIGDTPVSVLEEKLKPIILEIQRNYND